MIVIGRTGWVACWGGRSGAAHRHHPPHRQPRLQRIM